MMDRIAIFNYMIGNYDWAVPNQHNIKVIKPLIMDPLNLAAAVPYDFDFTGLGECRVCNTRRQNYRNHQHPGEDIPGSVPRQGGLQKRPRGVPEGKR